jgi:hypothetical protein
MTGSWAQEGLPKGHPEKATHYQLSADLCVECGQGKLHQNHWAPFGWHDFEPSQKRSIDALETKTTKT